MSIVSTAGTTALDASVSADLTPLVWVAAGVITVLMTLIVAAGMFLVITAPDRRAAVEHSLVKASQFALAVLRCRR